MGRGGAGCETDIAEMRQLARQRRDRRTEVQLDLARLFDLRGERGLREQRGGQHRILGQRGNDHGGFSGAFDRHWRHAPARQRGGMRVDRSLELR